MKKRLYLSVYFEIDFDKEREHLKKFFKGRQLARHLKLVDLFEQGKFDEYQKAYAKLPYDSKEECPEQEYVSETFTDIFDSVRFGKFTLEHTQYKS